MPCTQTCCCSCLPLMQRMNGSISFICFPYRKAPDVQEVPTCAPLLFCPICCCGCSSCPILAMQCFPSAKLLTISEIPAVPHSNFPLLLNFVSFGKLNFTKSQCCICGTLRSLPPAPGQHQPPFLQFSSFPPQRSPFCWTQSPHTDKMGPVLSCDTSSHFHTRPFPPQLSLPLLPTPDPLGQCELC